MTSNMPNRSRSSSTGAQHRDGKPGVIDGLRTTTIYSSLSTLLFSEKFSDMTICCGGREFKAHRAVVCTQSPFFDKAMSNGFQESVSGVINLPEDDPDVLERFLQFLYTGTYEDGVISTWDMPSHVAMMSSGEILEELNNPPGVSISHIMPSDDNSANSATTTPQLATNSSARRDGRKPEAFQHEDEDENESDDEYTPPSESDNGSDEPEEEYNEFWKSECDFDSNAPESPVSKLKGIEVEEVKTHFSNLRQDLFLPLRLYIMADRYDVPPLRLLARDRFYRSAEISWNVAECFPSVVDELYSYTPESNVAMREIVCRLVANRLDDDETRKRLEPVMRKHGDFAVGVINWNIIYNRGGW